MLRSQLLEQLSKYILKIKQNSPVRVAIDGIDAAGKTRLAKELAFQLKKSGRQIIQVSVDDFHNTQEQRYRRGKESPEGYYYDSFNYPALIEKVLQPLSPEGSRTYLKSWFNFKQDFRTQEEWLTAEEDAILLVDGIFLMRPELFDFWDVKIFVDIQFDTSIERAIERDLYQHGSIAAINRLYQLRYIPGQKIYFERCFPHQRADVIIRNDDFRNPELQFQKTVA